MRDSLEKQLFYYNLGEDYYWFAAHYDISLMILERYLIKYSSDNKNQTFKILDAGCGPGNFVSRLRNYGNVFGTDFSVDALKFCTEKHRIPVFSSNLEKEPIQDSSFDCVVALESLEHIEGDVNALNEFFRILKPGGIGLISVPAFMILWGGHDEWAKHFRRYSRKELIAKVKNAGFDVVQCDYIKCSFFLPLLVLRKAKQFLNKCGEQRQDDFYSVAKWMNSFFKWLLVQEVNLGINSIMPFGPTLVCVFRKSGIPNCEKKQGVIS